MSVLASDGLSVTYPSDRTESPDLRLIHYNDVYHVEYGFSFLRGVAENRDYADNFSSQDQAPQNP